MANVTLPEEWDKIQYRNIDPFTPVDSDNHNMLTRITGSHKCYISGFNPYYNLDSVGSPARTKVVLSLTGEAYNTYDPDEFPSYALPGGSHTNGICTLQYMTIDFFNTNKPPTIDLLIGGDAGTDGRFVVVEYEYIKDESNPNHATIKSIEENAYQPYKHLLLFWYRVPPVTNFNMSYWNNWIAQEGINFIDYRFSRANIPQWAFEMFVKRKGDDMLGPLYLAKYPEEEMEAVNHGALERFMAIWGIKKICDCATVDHLASLSGTPVIDGYPTVEGSRILVWNQNQKYQNGIYEIPEGGGTWIRSKDMNEIEEAKTPSVIFVFHGIRYRMQHFFIIPAVIGDGFIIDSHDISIYRASGLGPIDLSDAFQTTYKHFTTDWAHPETLDLKYADLSLNTTSTGMKVNVNDITGSSKGDINVIFQLSDKSFGRTNNVLFKTTSTGVNGRHIYTNSINLRMNNAKIGINKDVDNNYAVDVQGYLRATRVYNAIYNDLAECFDLDPKCVKDDVDNLIMELNENGMVQPATENSQNVIGVVSDTYGYLLGGNLEDIQEKKIVPLGLSGTVWVKADKEVLDTAKATMFVVSAGKGKAKAVDDFDKHKGSIFGKIIKVDKRKKMLKIFIQMS